MISVLKYGGTSLGDTSLIIKVASYLKSRIDKGEKLCVVVSAMGSRTNELMSLASEMIDNPSGRELDRLLSTGENMTISLLALALESLNIKAKSLTADQIGIITDCIHNKARIKDINKDLILEHFNNYDILIVAGFQGVTTNNEITTLGRGGSDTSAVALASVLKCDCEIYTDVNGIYTTDPRVFPKARKLDYITYEEMSEMSALGAGVMHNRGINLARNNNVVVYVARALSKEKGTYIMDGNNIEKNLVTALSHEEDVISVSMLLKNVKNIENEVFKMLTNKGINIDMISYVIVNECVSLGFTSNESCLNDIELVISEFSQDILEYKITSNYAKVSLIGSGMRDAVGVVNKLFEVLAKNDIKFYQATTSEITISILIKKDKLLKSVKAICSEFMLGEQ